MLLYIHDSNWLSPVPRAPPHLSSHFSSSCCRSLSFVLPQIVDCCSLPSLIAPPNPRPPPLCWSFAQQLAVFFTNLADAKEMLREMVQAPAYKLDARILVVSMEKAYSMVKAGPRPTGCVLLSLLLLSWSIVVLVAAAFCWDLSCFWYLFVVAPLSYIHILYIILIKPQTVIFGICRALPPFSFVHLDNSSTSPLPVANNSGKGGKSDTNSVRPICCCTS